MVLELTVAKIVRVLLLLIVIERICLWWLELLMIMIVLVLLLFAEMFSFIFAVIRVAYGDHSEIVTIVDGGCMHFMG